MLCSHDQARTLDERVARAEEYRSASELPMRVLVDRMDNAFENNFAAWPERFFIFDCNQLAMINWPVPHAGHMPGHIEFWLQIRFDESAYASKFVHLDAIYPGRKQQDPPQAVAQPTELTEVAVPDETA